MKGEEKNEVIPAWHQVISALLFAAVIALVVNEASSATSNRNCANSHEVHHDQN